MRARRTLFIVVLATIALVAAACQAGGPPTGQTTVFQVGKVETVPVGAEPAGWDTPESLRGGLKLIATYDSSGPDAWDASRHPVVYITSEGIGYRHRPARTLKHNGVQVIDAVTKRTVASAIYDLGREVTFQPHGLGVSPDGKWIYIGTSDQEPGASATRDFAAPGRHLVLVINARTLKLDTLLSHPPKRLHHIAGFKDFAGNDRVVLNFGFGADGGPHFLLDPKDRNKVVQAITYDEVRPMGHPYTTPSHDGKFLYISMGSPWIRDATAHAASIAKFDLERKSTRVIHGVGNHPIGIAHSPDGKFTYVVDGKTSYVFKIDNQSNAVVDRTSAGVAGPYGIALGFDGRIYTIGKGEGTHNTGGVVGVLDGKTFRPVRDIDQPVNIQGSIIDHGIINPDPSTNELWVSSAGTFETIVLDLTSYRVKARIPTPNGGDTHSGAFVRYDASWNGELLADMFGPKAAMVEALRARPEWAR